MSSTYGAEIVAQCEKYMGLKEEPIGSNNGHALRLALAGTAWKPGDFWCLDLAEAIISAVYKKHGKLMPAHLNLTGSCHELLDHVRNTAPTQIKNGAVSTGSIVLLLNSDGKPHHAGICLGMNGQDGMNTFEGNTNSDGSSEGYEALYKIRSLRNTLIICH